MKSLIFLQRFCSVITHYSFDEKIHLEILKKNLKNGQKNIL